MAKTFNRSMPVNWVNKVPINAVLPEGCMMAKICLNKLLFSLLLLGPISEGASIPPRECHVCPKPLSFTIEQCMNTVYEMKSEVAASLNHTPGPLNICREDMVGKNNTVLAHELMDTYSEIRCFAAAPKRSFSQEDIGRINKIQIGLTEINMSPEVCVYDNFSGDCTGVDTSNKTILYAKLRKEWVILDALLINIQDESGN